MSPEGAPRLPASLTVVPLCDGGAVVVDDGTLAGVVLNPVGAFVLDRMREGKTGLSALVDAVAAEFDAPRTVIEEDVTRFVEELRTSSLLR